MKVALVLLLLVAIGQCAVSGTSSFSFSQISVPLHASIPFTVTISPAPLQPVSFSLSSTNPQVATVIEDRLLFNTGVSSIQTRLLSPINGRIGTARLILQCNERQLYSPSSANITVQGNVTLSVASNTCFGVGTASNIIVTISPPANGAATLSIPGSFGTFGSSITIPNGQSSGLISFTPGVTGPITVTVVGQLYLSASIVINAIGSISANAPEFVLVGAVNPLQVVLTPPPATAVTLTSTTHNAQFQPASTVVPAGSNGFAAQLIGSSAGPASFVLSAAGYCPLNNSFIVDQGLVCSPGYQLVMEGTFCQQCPGASTSVCNNAGLCTYSTCDEEAVRCACVSPYVGYNCNFGPTSNYQLYNVTTAAQNITISGVAQTAGPITLSIPKGIFGTLTGQLLVAPYNPASPFPGAVNPNTNPPGSNFNATTTGFLLEALCSDNTHISYNFNNSMTISIPLDRTRVPPAEFELLDLYRWDPINFYWALSGDECALPNTVTTHDLFSYVYTAVVCVDGQYNLFYRSVGVIIPARPNQLRIIQTSTGATGIGPVPPPPTVPNTYNPSAAIQYGNGKVPLFNKAYHPPSSASTTGFSLFTLLLLLVTFIAL